MTFYLSILLDLQNFFHWYILQSWKLKRPQIQLRPHHFWTYISNLTTVVNSVLKFMINGTTSILRLVLLWTQLTKIYLPLPTSAQPISITKTLRIVSTKNERDTPLFTSKLLIKFQNILRNTTQVIIRHRVKILFYVISSPITLERQKWKSSKMKGILLSSPVNSW